ncbi:hypothetical protein [Hoeflea poritis]|uniref:Uncharacterized protein n=1 Tax=Hoeflea poritis TaxID=2993659 RepID=A0ABT4VRN8_9HYPH|nr:hypothetical protein [Hoeflea poritis]MDA4847369.1 hypothetical protein [Hoeflea poritis]
MDKATESRRLSDVVRKARIAAAEREDVVVEMRDADRARLELLADELEPVFKEVPAEDDQFDFFLSSGEQPRLWIDAIAHVQMGPDRRTYRFVRDTRYGRVVIAESADLMSVADSITHYVAERMVQRQRFLASDTVYSTGAPGSQADKSGGDQNETSPARQQGVNTISKTGALQALSWFALGLVVAALLIMAVFWEQLAPVLGAD